MESMLLLFSAEMVSGITEPAASFKLIAPAAEATFTGVENVSFITGLLLTFLYS